MQVIANKTFVCGRYSGNAGDEVDVPVHIGKFLAKKGIARIQPEKEPEQEPEKEQEKKPGTKKKAVKK